MTPNDLIQYPCRLRRRQLEMLRKLSTLDIKPAYHIRLAVDMYLSHPSIQRDLAAKQEQV